MISIIVPAYNEGKYLGLMYDCILKQTYKDYEVITVNDGSKDNTQDVIDEYITKYPDIFSCIQQENQGLSASRNNAMKVAKGEYIAFLDADDIISDTYLEKLYNAISLENADISKCSYEDFDNKTGETLSHIDVSKRFIEYAPGKHYVFQYCAWGGLYRTRFLKENELLFSVGEQMEDSPFSLMANQLASKSVVVGDTLYFHRMHENSIMADVKRSKSNPKIPYRGFEEAVNKVPRSDFGDYCFLRVLADYSTERYKTQSAEVRHQLIEYIYRIMDTYFPDACNNPFVKKNLLHQIPAFEKLAVRLFCLSYKCRILYTFSSATSLVLRNMK